MPGCSRTSPARTTWDEPRLWNPNPNRSGDRDEPDRTHYRNVERDWPRCGATLPMNGLTALQSLELLSLSAGQIVAVTGAAGAVGGYVVQLAKAAGLTVIADASEKDEGLVASLGADIVIRRGDDVALRIRDHGALLRRRVGEAESTPGASRDWRTHAPGRRGLPRRAGSRCPSSIGGRRRERTSGHPVLKLACDSVSGDMRGQANRFFLSYSVAVTALRAASIANACLSSGG